MLKPKDNTSVRMMKGYLMQAPCYFQQWEELGHLARAVPQLGAEHVSSFASCWPGCSAEVCPGIHTFLNCSLGKLVLSSLHCISLYDVVLLCIIFKWDLGSSVNWRLAKCPNKTWGPNAFPWRNVLIWYRSDTPCFFSLSMQCVRILQMGQDISMCWLSLKGKGQVIQQSSIHVFLNLLDTAQNW